MNRFGSGVRHIVMHHLGIAGGAGVSAKSFSINKIVRLLDLIHRECYVGSLCFIRTCVHVSFGAV